MPTVRKLLRVGVVGRREPTVRKLSNSLQADVRSPAADPDRDAGCTLGLGLQVNIGRLVEASAPGVRVRAEQVPKSADSLVESGPSLFEVDAGRFIVAAVRTRPQTRDYPSVRKRPKGCQSLGQLNWSPDDWERNGRHELDGLRGGNDCGQR